MAIYDNLPVFKDTYQLLFQFVSTSRKVQREFRYTVCEDVKKEIIDLCVFIYRANGSYEKSVFIGQAREKIMKIKLYFRILGDAKQIGEKQHAALIDHAERISKQLASWDKYMKTKSMTQNKEKEA